MIAGSNYVNSTAAAVRIPANGWSVVSRDDDDDDDARFEEDKR